MQLRVSQFITFCVLLATIAFLAVFGCKSAKGRNPDSCKVSVMAFTAEWCAPCKRAKPALIAIQASGVQVTIVDIDKKPDMARKYGITSVPTFIVRTCKGVVRTQKIATVMQLTEVCR